MFTPFTIELFATMCFQLIFSKNTYLYFIIFMIFLINLITSIIIYKKIVLNILRRIFYDIIS